VKPLFFMIFLANVLPALGRLGETREQCDARYGNLVSVEKEFRPDFPQYCYAKNDVEIRVRFWQGKVGQIIIGSDHGMDNDTITEILKANAQGSAWQLDPEETNKMRDPNTYRTVFFYRRADGLATATYYKMAAVSSDTITIETVEFKKAFEAKASGFRRFGPGTIWGVCLLSSGQMVPTAISLSAISSRSPGPMISKSSLLVFRKGLF